jgi:hypothetical protein
MNSHNLKVMPQPVVFRIEFEPVRNHGDDIRSFIWARKL